jgi:excisionase family DNA binding protein
MGPRFLKLEDVAEILNVSVSQVKALVRRHDLRAVRIPDKGVYRVEVAELEAFIARLYEQEADRADDTSDQ